MTTTPGRDPQLTDTAILRAIEAARCDGCEEGKRLAKAEMSQTKQRWTDHWQVKAMIGLLVTAGGFVLTGGTWLVSDAVGGGKKDVEQDGRLRAVEDRFGEIQKTLEKQDLKLDEIRREVKK